MYFLYHRVPPNMRGNSIVPLNELRSIDPELYAEQVSKYDGRESIMKEIIHPFGCLWNDVVFLSPVHPKDILDALTELGMPMSGREFFKINAATLDPLLTTVWLHQGDKKTPDTFLPFRLEELDRYRSVPIQTRRYYRAQRDLGIRPLVHAYTPHILYKGSIDVSNAELIQV